MKSYELRLGYKKVYGLEQTPGTVTVRVDCDVLGEIGCLTFTIPTPLADELFAEDRRAKGRAVQDIAPTLAPWQREVFVSGQTIMEAEQSRFHASGGDGLRPDFTLARYEGAYVVDCPNCEARGQTLLAVKGRGKDRRYCCPKCAP